MIKNIYKRPLANCIVAGKDGIVLPEKRRKARLSTPTIAITHSPESSSQCSKVTKPKKRNTHQKIRKSSLLICQ